jgi:hypothetical protein
MAVDAAGVEAVVVVVVAAAAEAAVATDAVNVAPRQCAQNCNTMAVHAAANCFVLPADKDQIPSL